jgi:hypothetical protein
MKTSKDNINELTVPTWKDGDDLATVQAALDRADELMSRFTDQEKVEGLRREAEDLRTGKSKSDFAALTAEQLAGALDEYANAIEAGEVIDGELVEEEQTPEELAAEIEAFDKVIDFLQRNEANSLAEFNERCSKREQDK